MTSSPLPEDIQAMSFEQAMDELRGIVDSMERGDAKLDQAIAAYERGALLRAHCEAKLKEAKMKIEQISLGADGSPRVEPFEGEA
jgi:exodeoxyribonuclease VII small subunit